MAWPSPNIDPDAIYADQLSPRLSPDGTAFAALETRSSRQVGLDGSPPITVIDIGTDVTGPFVYSADASRLAAHAARAYDRGPYASTPIWGLLLVGPDGSNAQVIGPSGGRQLIPDGGIEWAGPGVVLFAAADSNQLSGSVLIAVQPDGTGETTLVGLGEFADFDWITTPRKLARGCWRGSRGSPGFPPDDLYGFD